MNEIVLTSFIPEGGGGGATPLLKPYRYVPPLSVWFLGLFRLKVKQMNKNEVETDANSKLEHLKKFFVAL